MDEHDGDARLTLLQVLGPSTGGIRSHVAELARQTEALGWCNVVAGPDGVMDGVGEQHAVISGADGWTPRTLPQVRRRLRRHVRTADVVHAHGLKAAALVLSIPRRAPVVVTLHNDAMGTHGGVKARVARLVQAALLRRADHVVFVSRSGAAAHRTVVRPGRHSVMMSFAARPVSAATRVETREGLGLDDRCPLVVVVARLHPQKHLGMFLDALARTREAVPDVRVIIAGDGPQRDELESARSSLGLTDVVGFIGATAADAVADLIAAADVLAVPSRWEAGPIVAVEAMQLGTPVVMTCTGAVAELAGERCAAQVVPVGDTDAFAAALSGVLMDAELRSTLAARGRALAAEEFDASMLVHRIDAVYRSLLRQPTTLPRT